MRLAVAMSFRETTWYLPRNSTATCFRWQKRKTKRFFWIISNVQHHSNVIVSRLKEKKDFGQSVRGEQFLTRSWTNG